MRVFQWHEPDERSSEIHSLLCDPLLVVVASICPSLHSISVLGTSYPIGSSLYVLASISVALLVASILSLGFAVRLVVASPQV